MTEKIGLAVHLLIDGSGSMRDVIDKAQQAANDFIETLTVASMPATVTVAVFQMGSVTTLVDAQPAYNLPKVTGLHARGGTPLCDAIGLAVNKLDDTDAAQKAIIVITDGMDEGSARFSKFEIQERVSDRRAKGWLLLFLGLGGVQGYGSPASHAPKLGFNPKETVACKLDRIKECMEIAALATLRYQGGGDSSAGAFTAEERSKLS